MKIWNLFNKNLNSSISTAEDEEQHFKAQIYELGTVFFNLRMF